jgi:hypothetical protein
MGKTTQPKSEELQLRCTGGVYREADECWSNEEDRNDREAAEMSWGKDKHERVFLRMKLRFWR